VSDFNRNLAIPFLKGTLISVPETVTSEIWNALIDLEALKKEI